MTQLRSNFLHAALVHLLLPIKEELEVLVLLLQLLLGLLLLDLLLSLPVEGFLQEGHPGPQVLEGLGGDGRSLGGDGRSLGGGGGIGSPWSGRPLAPLAPLAPLLLLPLPLVIGGAG